ncbi:MAG: sigma-70 family RNA polymerase sigma factor, partial [Clostridia bacterium]|nr:sigma-70 family RNA polymerase sigma factor [Clostridia bacterium]
YVVALTKEDWIQEGMIGLLLAVRTFNKEKSCSFSTYASVCIANRLRSVCKKALGNKNEPLNNSLLLDDTVVPPAVSTEDDYIENEEYTFFTEKYVSVLSTVEKSVVEYYIAGFSYSEIADKLAMTEKSVDNALFRAKTKLKKAFS